MHGTYTVAAGHTLIMEAGVQVLVKPQRPQVNGELTGNGTAASPIVITLRLTSG